jgi:hypothetical protein
MPTKLILVQAKKESPVQSLKQIREPLEAIRIEVKPKLPSPQTAKLPIRQ